MTEGNKDLTSLFHMLFAAFNARDADAMLAHFAHDIDYPDGDKRLRSHDAIRHYWTEQWKHIDTKDEVTDVRRLADDQWVVSLSQVVRNMHGSVLSRGRFEYVFHMQNDLVQRMDIHPL